MKNRFFNKKIGVRVTNNTFKMLKELYKASPDKYKTFSDIIRVGIIKLHREETERKEGERLYKILNPLEYRTTKVKRL